MASKIDTNGPLVSVSESDQKFFATLMKYLPMSGSINMNWEAFAEEMGFKNVSIAKVRFNQIRRKFDSSKATGTTQDPLKATKSTKVMKSKKGKETGKGRGKKVANDLDHDKEDDEKVTIKDDWGDEDGDRVKKEDDN
ncbi:hypothetical protein F5Y06DRAFT_301603 [Hypoxylon sp. FL0890]|nr:hypothetical protein F5Y06DRAFT_301603 [Hypoxylon sp. FL0890]